MGYLAFPRVIARYSIAHKPNSAIRALTLVGFHRGWPRPSDFQLYNLQPAENNWLPARPRLSRVGDYSPWCMERMEEIENESTAHYGRERAGQQRRYKEISRPCYEPDNRSQKIRNEDSNGGIVNEKISMDKTDAQHEKAKIVTENNMK